MRRRFNDAVLKAVYIKDRRIGRAEFSDVFALQRGKRAPHGEVPPFDDAAIDWL